MSNEIEKSNITLAPANFVDAIKGKYSAVVGGVTVTEKEVALMYGYIACINDSLIQNNISWSDIDSNALARDLAYKARLGLDMQMPNYLYFVPYRGKSGRVTISLINGYKGEMYLAMKFARETPLNIITELVYENDVFSPIKRDANHPGDDYIFEIADPFNRGKVKGGFGYIQYKDPAKNVLVWMTLADIVKHKPAYASGKFWDSWSEEMYLKTVVKKTCKKIVLDVDKYNQYRDAVEFGKTREVEYAQEITDIEAGENTAAIPIDVSPEPTGVPINTEIPAQEPVPATVTDPDF